MISARKRLFDPAQAPSKWDMKVLQESVDDFYRVFIKEVAKGRGLTYKNVAAIAQGRVWTGNQALNLKLVDALGGLKEAFQEAKVLSGFEQDEKVPLIRWEPPIVSILQCFAGAENFRYCFMRGDLTQEDILASRWEEMSHVEARKIHRFLSAAKKTEPQALWLDHFGLKIR